MITTTASGKAHGVVEMDFPNATLPGALAAPGPSLREGIEDSSSGQPSVPAFPRARRTTAIWKSPFARGGPVVIRRGGGSGMNFVGALRQPRPNARKPRMLYHPGMGTWRPSLKKEGRRRAHHQPVQTKRRSLEPVTRRGVEQVKWR